MKICFVESQYFQFDFSMKTKRKKFSLLFNSISLFYMFKQNILNVGTDSILHLKKKIRENENEWKSGEKHQKSVKSRKTQIKSNWNRVNCKTSKKKNYNKINPKDLHTKKVVKCTLWTQPSKEMLHPSRHIRRGQCLCAGFVFYIACWKMSRCVWDQTIRLIASILMCTRFRIIPSNSKSCFFCLAKTVSLFVRSLTINRGKVVSNWNLVVLRLVDICVGR